MRRRDPRRGRPRLGATPVHAPVRSPTATAGVIPRSRPCSQDRHLSRTIGTSGSGRNVGCVPATLPSTTRRHLAHDGRGRYSRISSPRSRHSRTLLTDVTHGRYSWISSHISLSHSESAPRRGARGRGRTRQPDIETTQRKHPERPPMRTRLVLRLKRIGAASCLLARRRGAAAATAQLARHDATSRAA